MSRLLIALLLIAAALLGGCREERQVPPGPTGEVLANAAYRQHFGPPPQAERGVAYARVGYLPLRERPERLRAIPLFLFAADDQLRQLLGRLVGSELILDPQGPLLDPFADGTSLQLEGPEAGTLTLNLEVAGSPVPPAAGIRALVETACQFETVERVVVLVAGAPGPGMPPGGYRSDPQLIEPPGPPQPVMLAGMWDAPGAGPEEILFNFDRPVTVNSFRLLRENGTPVAGDTFISVFDMAVVLRPDGEDAPREGEPLTAEWRVTDALGRSADGRTRYPLLRFEHRSGSVQDRQ